MVTCRYAHVYTSCFPVFASACFLFFSSFCTYQPVPYQGVHNVSCLRLVVPYSRQACMTTPASPPLVSSSCLLPVVPGSSSRAQLYRPLASCTPTPRRRCTSQNHPHVRCRPPPTHKSKPEPPSHTPSLACVARMCRSHTPLACVAPPFSCSYTPSPPSSALPLPSLLDRHGR